MGRLTLFDMIAIAQRTGATDLIERIDTTIALELATAIGRNDLVLKLENVELAYLVLGKEIVYDYETALKIALANQGINV